MWHSKIFFPPHTLFYIIFLKTQASCLYFLSASQMKLQGDRSTPGRQSVSAVDMTPQRRSSISSQVSLGLRKTSNFWEWLFKNDYLKIIVSWLMKVLIVDRKIGSTLNSLPSLPFILIFVWLLHCFHQQSMSSQNTGQNIASSLVSQQQPQQSQQPQQVETSSQVRYLYHFCYNLIHVWKTEPFMLLRSCWLEPNYCMYS